MPLQLSDRRLTTLLAALGLQAAATGCSSLAERSVAAAPEPPVVIGARGQLAPGEAARAVDALVAGAPAPQAMRSALGQVQAASGRPLYKDNVVRLLVDGPVTYEAMLAAIESAAQHIHLETYIFSDDAVGRRFADALIDRRRAGVEVRIIYDSIGSLENDGEFFERIGSAGIDVVEFHPVNPIDGGNPLDVNNRDHRKLLVVDGQIAFTGGININRAYSSSSIGSSNAAAPENRADTGWRDTHLQVEGPAVAAFQQVFIDNWREHGGADIETDERYFPPPQVTGNSFVRVLTADGGEGRFSTIHNAYLTAMRNATEKIWITQAYFSPDSQFLDIIKSAAGRGVDVRIIVPGRSDSAAVYHASRAKYAELLRAGVRIFETDGTMLHAKSAVIDAIWSTVGSSNLDHRSFLHNDEINAVVLGRDFGRQMELQFQVDEQQGGEIALRDWKRRPLSQRLKEFFSSMVAYWL